MHRAVFLRDLAESRPGDVICLHFVLQPIIEVDLLAVHLQDLGFFRLARIVGHQFEHETIQLGFGQIVGAFRFDRILCGQHQKGAFDFMALSRRR